MGQRPYGSGQHRSTVLMKMLYTTFSYVNSALQHQSLNRGPWKATETRERVLAASGDTYVIIDILYNDTNNKVPGGATIPTDLH